MPDYVKAAKRAAQKYGVDEQVFLRMIKQESGFNPHARSPAGAQGISQFIPSTAKAYGVNLNDNRVTDDLEGAAKYLRANLDRTGGNYHQALSIYNSGRPDGYKSIPETSNYVRSILSGTGGADAPTAEAAKSGSRTVRTSRTIPGVDNSDTRRALILQFLQQRHNPQALVSLASGLQGAQDTPSRKVYSSKTVKGSAASTRATGRVKVASGANQPGKDLTPGIQKVLRQVAGVAGPLTVGTGTNHSKYTVDGNVSDHYSGNAADLPTTPGEHNIKLGRQALIAAGMPRDQAEKAQGGIYNIPYGQHRRIQVIFNTNEGGNHHNHVHVGVTGLGR